VTATDSPTYREAAPADVAAMARCRAADPLAGLADARMAAYFSGQHHPQLALLPRAGFVAIVNAAVIGYIAGHLTQRFDCQGELQYLYVAPAHRRSGVARNLLGRLAAWFGEQQALRVCVNVDEDSPGARPFYVSMAATDLCPHWMEWRDITSVLRGLSPLRAN
jgi:GNAT superfamily N-acetyltransferase